jgi:hypothetical protein
MTKPYILIEATVDADGLVDIIAKQFQSKEKAKAAAVKAVQSHLDSDEYELLKEEYEAELAEDSNAEVCEFYGHYYRFSPRDLEFYVTEDKKNWTITFDNDEFASGYIFKMKTWKIVKLKE